MSTLALELSDAGLLALPSEGEISAPSPGFAVINDDSIIVGRPAAARCRLTPRRVNTRFWLDVSTDELGPPHGRNLRTADLVWTHLHELWGEIFRGVTSVILTLAGGRREEQLGLILGIARSAGLPVDGMVDAAVAGAVGQVDNRSALHLDLELHRAVLSVLEPGPSRCAVFTSDRVGLAAINDAWLSFAASAFLKITRFDPFHSAASEQVLFDLLPAKLTELRRRNSVKLSQTSGEQVFSIELDRARVVAAVEHHWAEIDALVKAALDHRPDRLLLTARAAVLPGLADRLGALTGLEVAELPLAAAPAGALRFADRIRSPDRALPLVTSLATGG